MWRSTFVQISIISGGLVFLAGCLSPQLVGPSSFAVVSAPSPTPTVGNFVISAVSSAQAGAPKVVTVTAEDQSNQILSSFNGTVTLAATGSATGAGVVNLINGVGTLTLTDNVAETSTLSLSDTGGTGYAVSSTASWVVSAAGAAKFVIFPVTGVTVGSSTTVTVKAEDTHGNVATTYGGTVTLVASGSATGAGVVTLVNGVGTATLGDNTPQVVTLSLTDSGGTGFNVASTQGATFTVGAVPTKFVILPVTGATVGTTTAVSIKAEDSFGNIVTSYSGSVTLVASGSATGAGVVTITSGAGSATLGDTTPQVVNLSLSDSGGTGYNVASTQTATFSVGTTVNKLAFTGEPAPTGAAGSSLLTQPTVTAQDTYGNTITSSSTAITLSAFTDNLCTASATGTLSGSATTTSGVAPFSGVQFTKVGTIYLKASDGTHTTCSTSIAISPGAPSTLTFTAFPGADQACQGAAFNTQPAVTLYDSNGNLATNAAGNVTLTAFSNNLCTIGTGGFTATAVTPSSGVATFTNATWTSSGALYILAAYPGATSQCSNLVTVPASTSLALSSSSGNNQQAAEHTALSSPLAVSLTDLCGNPKNGLTVNWAVTTQASSIGAEQASIAATSVTNASGIASATPTVGYSYGNDVIQASYAGASGSPVSFNAGVTGGTGWTTVSAAAANEPAAGRINHSSHWTGSKYFVWGGTGSNNNYPACFGLNDGALYDPVAQTWSPVSTTNAPSARCEHASAIDTVNGNVYIWGGLNDDGSGASSAGSYVTTGAIYSVAGNSWTTMSLAGSPPGVRGWQMGAGPGSWWDSVNSRFVVWGGYNTGGNPLQTGAIFNPAGPSWTTIATANEPPGGDEFAHAYDSTNGVIYIWGGFTPAGYSGAATTGSFLNAATNTWTVMPNAAVTPAGRAEISGAWTGTDFVIWGGQDSGGTYQTNGYIYVPGTGWNNNIASTITGTPSGHTDFGFVPISGSRIFMWGGSNSGGNPTIDGGVLNVSTVTAPTWVHVPSTLPNTPDGRYAPGVIWTGSEIVLWGGMNGSIFEANGAVFSP